MQDNPPPGLAFAHHDHSHCAGDVMARAEARLKEAGQASEVIVVSIGPQQATETLRTGLATAGSKLVALAGVPFGTPGSTNLLHIVTLTGDELKRHEG